MCEICEKNFAEIWKSTKTRFSFIYLLLLLSHHFSASLSSHSLATHNVETTTNNSRAKSVLVGPSKHSEQQTRNSLKNETRLRLSQSINPSFVDKSFSGAKQNKGSLVSHNGDGSKMVAKQEIQCGRQIESSNDENDFKYGPGFVSKLRYKYLTLTLRQTTVSKQRPSLIQLRRTTSLNNLLDEDGGGEEEDDDDIVDVDEEEEKVEEIHKENGNCTTNGNHHHTSLNGNGESIKNGNGIHELPQQQQYQQQVQQIRSSRSIEKQLNLKRARSVEALLRDDHRPTTISLNLNPTIEDKIQSAKDRPVVGPPKRLISLIEDDERPPAGITKQTMRIFEATTNKKRNPTRPMSNEIANKIALFKGTTPATITITDSSSKPPIIGKKPNVPPRTTSPHLNNSEKFAKFTKEKTALPKLDINIIKNNLETKTNGGTWSPAENKEIYRNHSSSFSPANSDTSSPNVLSPFRNSMSPQLIDHPPSKPKQIATSPVENSTANSPLITSLSNKLSNLHMDTTTTTTTTSTPKANWNNNKSNNLLKIIDDTSPTSDKDTNGNNSDKVTNDVDVGGSKVISFSPKINNNCKTTDRESSSPPPEIMKISVVETEVKSSSIQKPTHAPPAPPIKSRDNHHEKSPTPPISTTVSVAVGVVKKKSWSSQTNDENTATSIVFNFSDRKDVPDYIDNDGLIIRKRRELPKVSHTQHFNEKKILYMWQSGFVYVC